MSPPCKSIVAVVVLMALPMAARAEPIDCPKIAGFVDGPFVPTEEVAREIYRIMRDQIAPRSIEEYPIITVMDEGDHWWASQTSDPPPEGYGGGQLYMYIDKCTGAISRVAFNK